jgi:hypothetical protein
MDCKSLRNDIVHIATGNYPPENATPGDILRLFVRSPRSLVGTGCMLAALFLIWQSALMLYNPYSRFLLHPRRNVEAELATKLMPPPPAPRTYSVSLADVKNAAQGEDIQDTDNYNVGTVVNQPASSPAPASVKGKKHSKQDKKTSAQPAQDQPDEGTVPLLRPADVHNDNVMKSHYLPEAPRGVEKSISSTLLVNASTAADTASVSTAAVSASTAPLSAATSFQAMTQISTSSAVDPSLSLSRQFVPPPPPPLAEPPGGNNIWIEVALLFLLPFVLAKISLNLKEHVLAELCARAAFVLSIMLAAGGIMHLLDRTYMLEGAAELLLGLWQARANHKMMCERFGFVPNGLLVRMADFAVKKGWLKPPSK